MKNIEQWEERIDDCLYGNDLLKSFSVYLSDISIRTKYLYLKRIEDFISCNPKDPKDFDFDDYTMYMNDAKYKEGGQQTTQGYQIVIYSALRRFSEYMYITKRAKEDYMASVKRPRFYESQKTIDKRDKGYLTESEIKLVLSQFNDCQTWQEWRDYAVILLILNTGMRRTALTQINVTDYSREEQSITVTDKGAKVRKFILNNHMCEVLDKWISMRMKLETSETEALFLMEKPYKKDIMEDNHCHVITVWEKERITSDSVYGIVIKHTKCIGGKTISPHKLRATYGTQLYNKTHDVYFVQSCMGHNSPTTTEKYIRGGENKTKDASELLNSLYS